MQSFDVFIAYISWDGNGKYRPVLVYSQSADALLVYPITTQYESKSDRVKNKLFAITDWATAGLHRPSYADTGTPLLFSQSAVCNKNPIGHLSDADQARFNEFMGY